jgi:hypothetical protein
VVEAAFCVFGIDEWAPQPMSASGPTRAVESVPSVPPEPQNGQSTASASSVPSEDIKKDKLQPQELLLLREFFLLLDEWDRGNR